MIYALVMEDDSAAKEKELHPGSSWKNRYPATDPNWTPALAHVCCLMRSQIHYLLLPKQAIEVTTYRSQEYLTQWLDSLSPLAGYHRIRRIGFNNFYLFPGISTSFPKNGDLELLNKCTGVESARFHFRQDHLYRIKDGLNGPEESKNDPKWVARTGGKVHMFLVLKYALDQLLTCRNLKYVEFRYVDERMTSDDDMSYLRDVGEWLVKGFADKDQAFAYEVRQLWHNGCDPWWHVEHIGGDAEILDEYKIEREKKITGIWW